MTTTDPADIERELADRLASSTFHASLGITLTAVRDGEVDLRMDAGPEHANLHGTVHGGVLATLADTAAGVAVRTSVPDAGAPHATVTLDVQYLAPATTGTLSATGRIVKLGRRIAFADAVVTDEHGAIVARAQTTVAVAPADAGGSAQ